MAGSRDFGKIINERRLSLGYSLGQLANRMGTTATKVRSWERGDAVPDDATMDQLAGELNLSTGVLRATLPEHEPHVDGADNESTSVVAAPILSDEEPEPAPAAGADESEAEAGSDRDDGRNDAHDAAEDEPSDDEIAEPTAAIAAIASTAVSEDEHGADEGSDADVDGDAAVGAHDANDEMPADDADTDEQHVLLDAPTEAVEVVPSGPLMEPASGGMVAAAPAMVATAPVRVDLNDVGIPESTGFFAPVERFMAVVFDPDKNYLAWIRLILIIIVFFFLLRVLAWAVPEFFDALKDILDTIESTPSEPDPATNFIEGLGRTTGA